jgi:hypothetical protein
MTNISDVPEIPSEPTKTVMEPSKFMHALPALTNSFLSRFEEAKSEEEKAAVVRAFQRLTRDRCDNPNCPIC